MNWLTIARKDFRDARRSKILWGTVGLYTLFVAVLLEANTGAGGAERSAVETAMSSLMGTGMLVLPLAVVVMAYLSVTGERESGSIKYLLGLPATRREVVVGKFLGRAAVATVAILVALLVGAGLTYAFYDTLPVVDYALFVVLSLYFVTAYVGIVVGVSAMAGSRGRALAGSLAVYVPLSVLWLVVDPRTVVSYAVETLLGLDPMPDLYEFLVQLSPSAAYAIAGNRLILGLGDGSADAFYLQDWFPLVVLLFWLVVPLTIGAWRFRRAQLG